jgi:hypothetical protein
MKIFLKTILFSITMLVLTAIFADEHGPDTTQENNVENQQVTTTPAQEKKEDSADAFIPTETISEDLSVPFPVDI